MRMFAKAWRTCSQSVRMPTHVRRPTLTPMRRPSRKNLFTDNQLLFPGLDARLIKPALVFFHHVNQQAITACDTNGRHDQGDLPQLAGKNVAIDLAGPALGYQSLCIEYLKSKMHARVDTCSNV